MREIKFRGKRIDNGQWVYGMPYGFKFHRDLKTFKTYLLIFNPEWDLEAQVNYLKDPIAFAHLEDSVWKVIPESVEQYVGMEDINKIEIYEGDIVKTTTGHIGKVFQRLGCWFVEMGKELGYYDEPIEVIGNIYENPELLEDKK